MDAIMFKYILRWEDEEANQNYTVYQKHYYGYEAIAVSGSAL